MLLTTVGLSCASVPGDIQYRHDSDAALPARDATEKVDPYLAELVGTFLDGSFSLKNALEHLTAAAKKDQKFGKFLYGRLLDRMENKTILGLCPKGIPPNLAPSGITVGIFRAEVAMPIDERHYYCRSIEECLCNNFGDIDDGIKSKMEKNFEKLLFEPMQLKATYSHEDFNELMRCRSMLMRRLTAPSVLHGLLRELSALRIPHDTSGLSYLLEILGKYANVNDRMALKELFRLEAYSPLDPFSSKTTTTIIEEIGHDLEVSLNILLELRKIARQEVPLTDSSDIGRAQEADWWVEQRENARKFLEKLSSGPITVETMYSALRALGQKVPVAIKILLLKLEQGKMVSDYNRGYYRSNLCIMLDGKGPLGFNEDQVKVVIEAIISDSNALTQIMEELRLLAGLNLREELGQLQSATLSDAVINGIGTYLTLR